MVCKNRGDTWFLDQSWVLITMTPSNSTSNSMAPKGCSFWSVRPLTFLFFYTSDGTPISTAWFRSGKMDSWSVWSAWPISPCRMGAVYDVHDLAHVSWVGNVLGQRCCTTDHYGRLGSGWSTSRCVRCNFCFTSQIRMLARGRTHDGSDSDGEEGERLLWEDVEVDFIARFVLLRLLLFLLLLLCWMLLLLSLTLLLFFLFLFLFLLVLVLVHASTVR